MQQEMEGKKGVTGEAPEGICHIVGAAPWDEQEAALLKGRLALAGLAEAGAAGAAGVGSVSGRPEDLVIAADAGLSHLEAAGIEADLVVGDWDTLGRVPCHENLVHLPVVKDVTDTFAAIEEGRARGYRAFCLYGCLGGRVEHTIANLQHLAYLTAHGGAGALLGGGQAVVALQGPAALTFDAGGEKPAGVSVEKPQDPAAERAAETVLSYLPLDRRAGSFLSVFAYSEQVTALTLEGLKYPLSEATLESGFPLGVSNEFLDSPAAIRWAQGTLLLVFSLGR